MKSKTMCNSVIFKLNEENREEILFEKKINLPVIKIFVISCPKKFGWVLDINEVVSSFGFILFHKKYMVQVLDLENHLRTDA